jgi:hypothetical protein
MGQKQQSISTTHGYIITHGYKSKLQLQSTLTHHSRRVISYSSFQGWELPSSMFQKQLLDSVDVMAHQVGLLKIDRATAEFMMVVENRSSSLELQQQVSMYQVQDFCYH